MTPILKLNQGSFHFMSISDCILQDVLMASSGQASGFQRKPGSVNFQRGGRSTSTLLIASLMLSVSSAAVLARDDSSSKSAAEEATQKSPAAEEATKKKKSAADEATNKALMKKLEAMEQRMQSLEVDLKLKEAQAARLGRAMASDLAAPNKNNNDLFGVAPSPAPGLKIGMYGEIKFGSSQNPAANGQWQNGFDMGRVVLLPTYQVTDNIVFNAEIEFEHAGSAFDNDDQRSHR
jgi:hypothetical protein